MRLSEMDQVALLLDPAAVYYGVDPFLISAMIQAEGGTDAFVKAVQCSHPRVTEKPQVLALACKTVRSLQARLYREGADIFELRLRQAGDAYTGEAHPLRWCVTDFFIAKLGAQWAPLGAANDPNNLNANWVGNVQRLYRKETGT